jgi:hypothetical protein
MALPKIMYPTFHLTIPSTNKQVKFRPFLVKEEKILLTAQTSGDKTDIINCLVQIINNCAVEELDASQLATFDLEYLFIKLRARSVNNIIEITYQDEDDGNQYKVEVNLDDVEVKFDPEHKNKIDINDTMHVIMRYPKPDMVSVVSGAENEAEAYFKILTYCMHYIVDGNQVYQTDDSTMEEREEFLGDLDINAFNQVEKFVQTLPKVTHEVSYTNSQGKVKNIKLEGLEDFFTFR